jgi:hypothetical protein
MNEKTHFGKAVGGAFLIGGLIGLVGEALIMLIYNSPIYETGVQMPVLLILLGLIGSIIFFIGDLWPKLEKFGGLGLILPFLGLAGSVSGMTFGIGMEKRSIGKGALAVLLNIAVKNILICMIFGMAIGTLVHFTGLGAQNLAPYPPGGILIDQPNPYVLIPVGIDPLAFIWSFLFGGFFCALAQAIMMIFKLSMPTMMILVTCLGAILTPLGAMRVVASIGGGGIMIMIIAAGEAFVTTFNLFLQGQPVPFISTVVMFVIIFAIGIAFGAIKMSLVKRKAGLRPNASMGNKEVPH